ncbi:MAG: cobalt ECF transporter T component CbiQ [Chloroflexi bacterium RBG_16_50_9]|nr:MAG: cobalt ECF transporter T component CbiQ [Chloroflexi bacterium RBG_16_50_9]
MKHGFLDKYSERDSLIHRLDPRTKFVAVFFFILAVTLTAPAAWPVFAVYFILIATQVFLSRVPILYIFKRSLVIIPFVVLVAVFVPFFTQGQVAVGFRIGPWDVSVTYHGLQVLGTILAKSWLSILALILLTSTTRMTDLLRGLERLRLPRVMVIILSFMYRYIFVMVDEVLRMKRARDSRNFGSGRRLWQIKTIGRMAGTLFIRSYERGERVYAAMLSRGYDGQSRTLNELSFARSDVLFCLVFGVAIISTGILTFLF